MRMQCIIAAWLELLLLPLLPLLPLQDWLFISYKRVDGVEYALLLATFGLVLAAGLEAGITGGILLAALHFAYRCGQCRRRARCLRWPGGRAPCKQTVWPPLLGP